MTMRYTLHQPIPSSAVLRLVDRETGLITSVNQTVNTSYFGANLFQAVAYVSNTRYLGPILADRIAAGTSFNKFGAFFASIGEAVERYCGNVTVRSMVHGSYSDLTARGMRALSPDALPLYSDVQYADKRFPFCRFTTDLPLRWLWGRSLTSNNAILVPASMALLNLHPVALHDEPRINFVNFSGIAAGSDQTSAILAALLEIIERDATALWWNSDAKGNAAAIDLSLWPTISEYVGARGERAGRCFKLFDISNEVAVPTIACMCFELKTSIMTMGFAARMDPTEAALKSLSEAAQLHQLSTNLLDPNSWIWKAQSAGIFHSQALAPYRSDRRYKDNFRSDYKDMSDLMHNSQYYLDPRSVEATNFLIASPNVRQPPKKSAIKSLDELVLGLAALGYDPIVVDLTTPDIADVGLTVVRVLVPGFIPNAPSAFPYLGSPRLVKQSPFEKGYIPIPIPHS
ncbi:YcaO-like family protein [Mesorhizobium sp.]|uniref:YcaO-like family protein n=1 Tax=Mesorhizobium sp. TaxID=1871066 RepID=UPI000FE62549|nr:YcaO-like family protein [Mesorhizobium sp.]RWP37988.1 MAG: hypothetical protein EOR03_03545 [Mesorhizobium sp.]